MTTNSTGVGTDPSVCYRHPGRQSWVLCQRCGRTICPECQILAPVGVHCPECVREANGGVQWRPARPVPVAAPSRQRVAANRVLTWFRSGSNRAVLTWVILGISIVVWVSGFFTAVPTELLAGLPGDEWQIWRYVTAPFAYPTLGGLGIVFFALNCVFFALNGQMLERMFGRGRFAAVVLASSVASTAAMLLAGYASYGLIGPLFGLFAALLVVVWPDTQARVQLLIMLGINFVINISLGGAASLPALIGGLLGGAGVMYVLSTAGDRTWKKRTPSLIIGGSLVGLVVVTIVRGLLLA